MKTRRIAAWFGASALLVFALVCLCVLRAGHFLEAPGQQPMKADLIFSLGGDNGGRVNGVLDLYRRGFAPRVMVGAEGINSKARVAYLAGRRATWSTEAFRNRPCSSIAAPFRHGRRRSTRFS